MSDGEKYQEYAVEVPGRGFVDTWNSFGDRLMSNPPPRGMTDLDRALDASKDASERYERMGCSDVAATVRIVARTVTIERSEWSAEWSTHVKATSA